MQALPYAHVISMKANGKFCDCCGNSAAPGQNLLRCTACNYEHYCNKKCQKTAWSYHKFECPLLRSRQPKIPSDSARLFTRLVYNYSKNKETAKLDPGWRTFKDLCHHAEEVPKDADRAKQFMELSFTLAAYVREENASMLPSSKELMEIFGRMVYNGITLVEPGMEYGIGIYISPTVFNHSCSPNACFVNDGVALSLRALTDIDTARDEICVNYIDPMSCKAARVEQLQKDYLFTCSCKKCSDTSTTELKFQASICPACAGYIVSREDNSLSCLTCSEVVSDEHATQRKNFETRAKELLEKSVSETNTIRELQAFLREQEQLIPECNIYIHLIKANLYAAESRNDNFKTAYDLGEQLDAIYRLHYPQYFPAIGEHQLKQARLAWNMCSMESAAQHYTEAMRTLSVTHGTQHSLCRLALRELSECQSYGKAE